MPKKVSTPPHVKGIVVNDEYVVFVCDSIQVTLPIRSTTDENLFLSQCVPCYMRISGRCSGGTNTIRRGNCVITATERYNLLNKTYYIPVTLPPHFWVYSKEYPNNPKIFTTALNQPKENDTRLEILFLGNTYSSGVFCLGGVSENEDYDRYDPWCTYNFYFKGIRNEDLNLTGLPIRQYLQEFSLDKQRECLKVYERSYTQYFLSNFINYETDAVLPPKDYVLKQRSKTGLSVSEKYYIEV